MEVDDRTQEVYGDIAARFGVLSRAFAELSSPDAVEELLRMFVSKDEAGIGSFLDRFDITIPNRCFWFSEVIERLVSTITFVQECCLRTDLSWDEMVLYIIIARRHGQLRPIQDDGVQLLAMADVSCAIPPSPFLDELKANGLVTCEFVRKVEVGVQLGLSPPERVCLGEIPH